jgi:hypothetical protein
MSILGKLLAVLNVLAAAGFAYFALMDWTVRQNWTSAVNRMALPVAGLPVSEDEVDPDGRPRIDKISDATLPDLFKPVGGLPAAAVLPEDKTQFAEVKRVHDKLRKEIDQADGEAAKRKKLRSLLLPLAGTLSGRQALLNEINKEPIDKLLGPEGPFEKPFSDVTKKRNEQDPENSRRLIANLLFGLSQNSPDELSRQRIAVVVGLKAFTNAVNERALALREMAQQVHASMLGDRAQFEKQQRGIIAELELLGRALEERKEELDRRQTLVNKHTALVKAREENIVDLKKDIDKASQLTKKALDELAQEQRRLFDAQDRVGNDLQKNQQLEQQIRTIENVR